jgi:RNA polymerase sigma-70 factor (ECF subfamily)
VEAAPVTDWNRIVREHGPTVFGTAWRILGHAPDAEDVVQEVFLEAHRLGRAQAVRHWRGLLRRMATLRALDCLRRRRPTLPLDDGALARPLDDPEANAVGRELADRLRQALGHLPPQEGSVFSLRYFEDLSYQEIAATLDISPGAVATALSKARARLEGLLCEAVTGEKP